MKMYLEIIWVWLSSIFFSATKFDYDYNKKIGQWLDEDKELIVSKYTSTLNGFELWTSNYPYSYGYPVIRPNIITEPKKYGLSPKNIVRLEYKVRELRRRRQGSHAEIEKRELLKEMDGAA